MKNILPETILASNSPRRKELLSMAGINFRAISVSGEEPDTPVFSDKPGSVAESQAKFKLEAALDMLGRDTSALVLAYDTVVAAGTAILGKPTGKEDAIRMIRMLSGRSHSVFTGFAFYFQGKKITGAEETKVFFRKMEEDEIEDYVDTCKPYDKAGAYGIQEKISLYITGIEGDYFNVMGLPLARTWEEIRKII